MFPLPLLSERRWSARFALPVPFSLATSPFLALTCGLLGARGRQVLADVFISYSRLDRERVQPIAERLSSLGYSVWWDGQGGQARVDEIERQFAEAPVVVTVWSDNARNSSWVLAQSARALDEEKLLQMRLDDIRLPAPFETLKVAELHGGRSEWGMLEAALAGLVRDGRPLDPIDHRSLQGAQPNLVAAPRVLLAAATIALMAFSGALTAAYNGVMRTDQLQLAMLGVLVVGALGALVAAQRLFSIRRAGG